MFLVHSAKILCNTPLKINSSPIAGRTAIIIKLKSNAGTEFMIRKDSVSSIGLANLQKLNKGGHVAKLKEGVVGGLFMRGGGGNTEFAIKTGGKDSKGKDIPKPVIGGKTIDKFIGNVSTATVRDEASEEIASETLNSVKDAVSNSTQNTMQRLSLPKPLDFNPQDAIDRTLQRIDFPTLEGYIFEGFIGALTNLKLSETDAAFDFPEASIKGRERLANIFNMDGPIKEANYLEAKRTLDRGSVQNKPNSIGNKVAKSAAKGLLPADSFTFAKTSSSEEKGLTTREEKRFQELDKKSKKSPAGLQGNALTEYNALIKKRGKNFNTGGAISGEDTVPAMLTPGEFVVNKKTAQKVGYNRLEAMNKKGIQGFNKGGVVGFNKGGKSGSGVSGGSLDAVFGLESLAGAATSAGVALATLDFSNPLASITALGFAATQAATALNLLGAGKFLKGLDSFSNVGKGFKRQFKQIGSSGKDFAKDLFTKDLGKQTLKSGRGFLGSIGPQKPVFGPQLGGGAKLGAFGARAAVSGGIGIAASLLAEAVTSKIADTVVGGKQNISGFEGRVGKFGRQVGVGEAQATGAVTGLASGAALGAGIGALGGPIGIAVGAAIGGITGAVIGALDAGLQQAAFNALKGLKESSENE